MEKENRKGKRDKKGEKMMVDGLEHVSILQASRHGFTLNTVKERNRLREEKVGGV